MPKRIQFRLNPVEDQVIEQSFEGHKNTTKRAKQLLRYGIYYEQRERLLQQGKIVVRDVDNIYTSNDKACITITV